MRVLFCGQTFPSSRVLLEQRLPDVECCVWSDREAAPVDEVDVLIPMMFPIGAQVMDVVRPRLIQQWGSGLEGVELDAARARGIPVSSVPTAGDNAESVAEHALLLMLSLLRKLPEAQANVRAGVLGAPVGRMLRGRAVCLWGLGATALALARRLRALDARLLGITRVPDAPKVSKFGLDACYSTKEREACLHETDILALCMRLCNETRGLIDGNVLAMLRAGAYLVNTSRGALVDGRALYSALSRGRLAGAGLDVFGREPVPADDPLLALPNVIATPHVAGVTEESYRQIADVVVANIERLQSGQPILNRAV